ncbi:MAG: hypothetical protein QOG90_2462 [Actinomycetota bacterium]
MPVNAPLAGAIHDLQARLGSIRIAVTAVAGLDLDEETRREMLTSASDESVRASAELAGVSALATCLLDNSPTEPCDLAAALQSAADAARLAGLAVDLQTDGATMATVSPARLQAVMPALLRLVGGAAKAVRATATPEALSFDGDDTEPLPPIVGYLIDHLGASIPITFGAAP